MNTIMINDYIQKYDKNFRDKIERKESENEDYQEFLEEERRYRKWDRKQKT